MTLSVTAVIVTYGDRAHLATRAAAGAMRAGVQHVVMVDNGSSEGSRTNLAKAVRSSRELTLLSLDQNEGSAVGYSAGIKQALSDRECAYVWLLDDDNDPTSTALGPLLREHALLATRKEAGPTALVSLRPERRHLADAAAGIPGDRIYPSKSSFLYFNVVDLLEKLRRELFRGPRGDASVAGLAFVPYAPYGGLFFHRDLVGAIGYPNSDLVVYEDDVEWTRRITSTPGGAIAVVASSLVRELEPSWMARSPRRNPLARLLLAESDARVYYALRNRVHFEVNAWLGSRSLYVINKCIYLTALRMLALRHQRRSRYVLIRMAISDGEAGRLGVRVSLKNI